MGQLGWQLVLGGGLIGAATALQAVTIGIGMMVRPHVSRRIRKFRLGLMSLVIALAALWMLTGQMIGVWLWSVALLRIGAFDALEPALYFTLSAYTTLGFGDVLAPDEWRVLGALAGANGMLGFGLATAARVEFVRRVREDLPHG